MTDFIRRLQDYGADTIGALERLVDDEALYSDCLQLFLRDEGFTALPEAIAHRDYSAAFESAHTLKGVAGNLGLTPLFVAICDIVEPLRRGEYGKLPALTDEVLAAREALDHALND
ncbi:MAG: Hpt domain-containing protein [Oscillospiraceae bacterium]